MLEKIHDEDWGQLSVLTGTAEHVPNAVLGLLSENEVEFEAAYWKLDNYVVVQGDLFSSAAVLPKYLEEVVLKAKYKERVVDLIWQIGTGYAQDARLQETCFNASVAVFESLLKNSELLHTKYHNMIENELKDMLEIEANG